MTRALALPETLVLRLSNSDGFRMAFLDVVRHGVTRRVVIDPYEHKSITLSPGKSILLVYSENMIVDGLPPCS